MRWQFQVSDPLSRRVQLWQRSRCGGRCLTDPWLTRHEDHSSRAAPGLFEPIVKLRQFCRASNHIGGSGLYLRIGRTHPG